MKPNPIGQMGLMEPREAPGSGQGHTESQWASQDQCLGSSACPRPLHSSVILLFPPSQWELSREGLFFLISLPWGVHFLPKLS